MQHHRADDIAFSAYNADNEDYYAFLPSDESISDGEDAPVSPIAAKNHDSVEELAAVFTSENAIGSSSKVLTLLGSLNGSKAPHKEMKKTREQVKVVVPGVFNLGGGEIVKVSPQTLELYDARKMQLQDALDAATGDNRNGEAPFRFAVQDKQMVKFTDEMNVERSSASPAPMIDRVEGHAPEKNNLGRRRPVTERKESDDEKEEEEMVEPDMLYDEQLDDADEQWVQTNFHGAHAANSETDAMLCCPCCFVTLCMACERHATYTSQYRATAAINCRVKRSEILTYASRESNCAPASLPFHKRQNLNTGSGHKTSSTTPGQQIASLLQADEYFSVACSDCGTIVGVFDQDRQYHFFNALPSNC
ncbi:unnamed protein product [Peronospora effusa]|uniref:E2F-associated phosphoprotein n=1 Tax=Peronospora effusa TaxID=542832 RepID=A0A3M6VBP6_9STRA|nr:hypothetical protein DD238_007837 [Peronospora effusa]RQM16055.1 hypothetical protein DD237_002337 [Peronospora effusa]CAI5700512.1 unnamed protein product [Peronospora effusa]